MNTGSTAFVPIQDTENDRNSTTGFYIGSPTNDTQQNGSSPHTNSNRKGPVRAKHNISADLDSKANQEDFETRTHSKPPKARFLMRRSSSAMRVRELRDVLSEMTSRCETPSFGTNDDDIENKVTGSQKARLLVASQQRLVSRLQDLRHQLDSMDNEVTRVKCDIMNSRRYFSAMTGIPYGPEWSLNRQMDSAYTSPTSFFSRSSEESPYSSDGDSPPSTLDYTQAPSHEHRRSSQVQALQQFDELADLSNGQLSRSDSCSSFLSWRSDVELAGVFPEEADPASVEAYKNMSAKSRRNRYRE